MPDQTNKNPPWTRDELILALDLYMQNPTAPPGKTSVTIQEFSALLNRIAKRLGREGDGSLRNPNGVYMKLMNFRRFDPNFASLGKVGLTRGNKLEEGIWNEFAGDPERLQAVASAIRTVILFDVPLASEEDDGDALEGRLLTRLHRYRERDKSVVARRKAKAFQQHGKLQCEVCDFDFEESYGSRGQGFIEAHHTKPLHTLPVDGGKTREADLALVCANCHRMIHASTPWMTISELRESVKK